MLLIYTSKLRMNDTISKQTMLLLCNNKALMLYIYIIYLFSLRVAIKTSPYLQSVAILTLLDVAPVPPKLYHFYKYLKVSCCLYEPIRFFHFFCFQYILSEYSQTMAAGSKEWGLLVSNSVTSLNPSWLVHFLAPNLFPLHYVWQCTSEAEILQIWIYNCIGGCAY